MFSKYSREISSVLIGSVVLIIFLVVSHLVKKESIESKNARVKEIQNLVIEKEKFTTEEDEEEELVVENKAAKIIGVAEIIPEKFSSYIVLVKVDLNNSTDPQKAIEDIGKACSIIGSAPMVLKTEIIGVQGRVCNDRGEELFDLDFEK